MSTASRSISRLCTCASRSALTSPLRLSRPASNPQLWHTRFQRWESTTAAAAAPASAKIEEIVKQISQLTLIETADLVSTLKSRLNIPDMPMGGFVGGAGGAAAPAAAPAAEEEEAAPKAEEKTLFNLKLMSLEATAKPKIIKEVKQLLGLSLVDSKKFVESAPKVLKESVPKEEGEKIMEAFKALGAVVAME